MIRMNRHMHALRAEETAAYLRRLAASVAEGDGLVLLVAEARDGNGHVPFREHDLAVLIERHRDGTNGITPAQMGDALDELEAMG